MTLIRIYLNIISGALLVICCQSVCVASEFSDKRAHQAGLQLRKFTSEKRELRPAEVLLYSIDPAINRDELLKVLDRPAVTVSAVHFCPKEGGAVAFFLEAQGSLQFQLGKIEAIGYDEVMPRISRTLRPSSPPTKSAVFKEPMTFCGFEIRASRAAMDDIAFKLGAKIRAVEIFPSNVRKLPINKND